MAFLKLFKKISKLEPGLANVLCGEDIVNTCERRSGGSIRVVMRPGEVVAYIITHNPSWDAPILRCLPHCRRWHGQFWLHDGEDAEDAKVFSYSVNFGILSLQASNALIRFRVGKVGSWLAK